MSGMMPQGAMMQGAGEEEDYGDEEMEDDGSGSGGGLSNYNLDP